MVKCVSHIIDRAVLPYFYTPKQCKCCSINCKFRALIMHVIYILCIHNSSKIYFNALECLKCAGLCLDFNMHAVQTRYRNFLLLVGSHLRFTS